MDYEEKYQRVYDFHSSLLIFFEHFVLFEKFFIPLTGKRNATKQCSMLSQHRQFSFVDNLIVPSWTFANKEGIFDETSLNLYNCIPVCNVKENTAKKHEERKVKK